MSFSVNKHRCALESHNHIQNVHMGRYIVPYMVGNHILWFRSHASVKLNFQPYMGLCIPPQMKILNTVIPKVYKFPSHYELMGYRHSWQIYLRSDKSCLVEGPTVWREILSKDPLSGVKFALKSRSFGPIISVAKLSVLIDQSKSGIGKPCTHNPFTIYCAVTNILCAMWEPSLV